RLLPFADRTPTSRPRTRPRLRVDRRPRRRGPAERGRDGGHADPVVRSRLRDHHQPDRQRAAVPAPQPRPVRPPAGRTRPRRIRRRGDAALREPGASRCPHRVRTRRDRRSPRWRRRDGGDVPRGGQPRPGGVRRPRTLRRGPRPEPPAELRGRHPLLPGRQPRSPRGTHRVRPARSPHCGHRVARRRPRLAGHPDPAGREPPPRPRHSIDRQRAMREVTESIAEALPKAAAVFASRGLDGTRMEDIVEASGVPRPTLYYRFASKEEILAWLLQRLLRALSIEIGGIVDRDEPARDRLRQVIAAYLQLFADHTQLCTVLLTELGRITRIPQLADAIWAAFHEPLGKVLDAGERDGSMQASDHE